MKCDIGFTVQKVGWLPPFFSLVLAGFLGQRAVYDGRGASGSGGTQGTREAGADASEEGGYGDQQDS